MQYPVLRDVRGLGEAVNLNSFSDEIHGLPPKDDRLYIFFL
ncbi:MAG: hypothetical protein ACP5FU_05885 [Nitrososphaeria archaeon]